MRRVFQVILVISMSMSIGTQAQALGLDSIAQELRSLIESDRNITAMKICGQRGICRSWGGLACHNPILFSLCWLICHKKEIFLESLCVQAIATKHLNFDKNRGGFLRNGQFVPLLRFLQESIYNPKNSLEKTLVCENVCPIAQSILAKNSQTDQLLEPLNASLLKAACDVGCR